MNNRLKHMVTASMFAAITTVATMVINIPTPGTNGYFNVGDTAVLLSAWLLGAPYGVAAAGIGSGLADLLSGYPAYIPGTVIIKSLMALAAFGICRISKRSGKNPAVTYIIGGLAAEIIMVSGYFLYEAFILGYGLAAAASLGSNASQGAVCFVLAGILIQMLTRIKYIKEITD